MALNKNDIRILQDLAKKYMEIAALPVQEKKKALWISLNKSQMQKPMLAMNQIPWHEMDVDGSLISQIKDSYWCQVETYLRQMIYRWQYIRLDMVVDPYILLPRLIHNTGYGLHVSEDISIGDAANSIVGHKYINQFEDMEDVEKIKAPIITIDRKGEKAILEEAEAIFKGIAPIKMEGLTVNLGLWDKITTWMGIENIYMELYDRPEFLHAIMGKITDATIAMIESLNKEKAFDVYSNLCHCSYTYSNDLPSKGVDLDNPTSKDVWAFGLAQLFTSTSPSITDEFEITYMKKIFPYFGAIYYGCCERLDDRIDIITKLPNIRKISCSPWSDREIFAQKMPKQYIMSNKPTPAFLAATHMDEELVRKDIRRTIRAARNHDISLELILKDISTVKYEPQRLWRWSQIAMEESEDF